LTKLIGSASLTSSGVPDDLLTTKGDTHGFSSVNARIPVGSNDQVLTADSAQALGLKWATPSTPTSTWTELISLKDTSASNGFDTGYVDMSTYRVLRFFWQGYASSGTDPFQVRFYDPDEAIVTTSLYGTSGFYTSNTLNTNGDQSSLEITFGEDIETTKSITFAMEINCTADSTNKKCAIGSYYLSQGRAFPNVDAVFCQGNFYWDQNDYFTELMIVNGLVEISSNVYTDCLLSVIGYGDNTS